MNLFPLAGIMSLPKAETENIGPLQVHYGSSKARTKGAKKITYGLHETPIGTIWIALLGAICVEIGFITPHHPKVPLKRLQARWQPTAITCNEQITKRWLSLFLKPWSTRRRPLKIYMQGTVFQLQVWRALLQIPWGQSRSYGQIARLIGQPKAVRAVGSAVGKNPLGVLIPCHRVLPSTGGIGNYYWGSQLKANLLAYERKVMA